MPLHAQIVVHLASTTISYDFIRGMVTAGLGPGKRHIRGAHGNGQAGKKKLVEPAQIVVDGMSALSFYAALGGKQATGMLRRIDKVQTAAPAQVEPSLCGVGAVLAAAAVAEGHARLPERGGAHNCGWSGTTGLDLVQSQFADAGRPTLRCQTQLPHVVSFTLARWCRTLRCGRGTRTSRRTTSCK